MEEHLAGVFGFGILLWPYRLHFVNRHERAQSDEFGINLFP